MCVSSKLEFALLWYEVFCTETDYTELSEKTAGDNETFSQTQPD